MITSPALQPQPLCLPECRIWIGKLVDKLNPSISLEKGHSQSYFFLSQGITPPAQISSTDHSQPFTVAINRFKWAAENLLYQKHIKITHNRNHC